MDLSRYRLLAQIGAGPEGVSYRALDLTEDRTVEVKVMAPETDPPRRRRLLRQLATAALLDHAGAVRIMQLALQHDPPFVVQEWVDGTPLDVAYQERLPLALAEAVALGCSLAATLAVAHHLGLVHEELWPGSLRITAEGSVKLDFSGLNFPLGSLTDVGHRLALASRAPEIARGEIADFAADIYGLGTLFVWLLTGQPCDGLNASIPKAPPPLERLLREMLAADPGARPWTDEVVQRLTAVRRTLGGVSSDEADTPDTLVRLVEAGLPRERLGRFQLVEKLGQGGMGEVYRAVDPADGSVVAVKTIRADRDKHPDLLRRFHKEARLLAEVNNPYVANLLEVNEEDGLPFLVLEFVTGQSLAKQLTERGQLDEPEALAILADVARALAEAHDRGIVHRDIKPDNILLPGAAANSDLAQTASIATAMPRAKLTDFGLARHVVQTESLDVTQPGAVVGTPLYLAPEQCKGGSVSPRTDVYAMGATLFRMLAGRPPFIGDQTLQVLAQHCNDPPPPLRVFNPAASDAVCNLISKCLAKAPEERYATAGELLADLERLLGGEPTSMTVHPRLPACNPGKVLDYEFRWELQAAPAELWPHVSNTERLNRAIGLSAVRFTNQADPEKGVHRFATIRKTALTLAWEEHPFEWVAPQRFGVLREFSQGPFLWLVSLVELTPRGDGGTTLTHRIRVEPRGLLGRAAAAIEVGIRGRRALDRVYHRIDAALATGATTDPFEEPAPLGKAQQKRLDALLDQLGARGVNPAVVERLGDYLAQAPPQEAARIRPLALARRLALDADQVVAACLHGASAGLFVLLWDILCPLCRVPSEAKDSLRQLLSHGRCEACNLDFELDFAGSVEMIFRVHPEVRPSELGTYCVGGPAHSPHVVAQVRLAAGERIELYLALSEGAYRLRGPQLPSAFDFQVHAGTSVGRWDLAIPRGLNPETPVALRLGKQCLTLTNESSQELLLRLERTAPRDDALTAARATALSLFRELFPGEVLSPDQLVRVATITLLVTELAEPGKLYAELGDAQAFHKIREHLRLLHDRIRQNGGAVVKTVGAGLVAVFDDPAAAVRVGLDLRALQAAGLELRAAIHRGPALAATVNDHLDYFGVMVHEATLLPRLGRAGELLLTDAVVVAPAVADLLAARGQEIEILEAELPGRPERIQLRVLRP